MNKTGVLVVPQNTPPWKNGREQEKPNKHPVAVPCSATTGNASSLVDLHFIAFFIPSS